MNCLRHRHRTARWHNIASRPIQVAGDRHEDGDGPDCVTGARGVLQPVSRINSRTFGRGVFPGGTPYLCRGQTGDRFRPLRGILLNMVPEGVKTIAPAGYKSRIIEILTDDDMEHRQGESGVRPRTNREPGIRQGCIGLHGRLDGRNLGPPFFCADQKTGAPFARAGINGLLPPYQDQIGLLVPGISRLYYEGKYWPSDIKTCIDPSICKWLSDVLYLIPLDPRPSGYDPIAVKHLDNEFVKELGDSGNDCWDSIINKNINGLGKAMTRSFLAWKKMLPNTVPDNIMNEMTQYISNYPGAITSGSGGGYALVVSEKNIKGAFRIKVKF